MKISSKILILSLLFPAVFLAGCQIFLPQFEGYMPLANIACKGFARNKKSVTRLEGKTIQLWAYLDSANIFPPQSGVGHFHGLSFHVKPLANDGPGDSIPVLLEGDKKQYAGLFKKLNTLAKQHERETIVLLTGTVQATEMEADFNAPAGIVIHITSTESIQFKRNSSQEPRLFTVSFARMAAIAKKNQQKSVADEQLQF
ncbi:hypothetical protein [Desulfomarina sp.]